LAHTHTVRAVRSKVRKPTQLAANDEKRRSQAVKLPFRVAAAPIFNKPSNAEHRFSSDTAT
jgi:hypothetical protein